ncbi:hypothetical protein ABMY26_06580 (plasmid) [Azospirillum sp. HJ39]|uniref:hypothetical protein n=1 Tax=Azospirillum sp. HJ39 TaxID=3159496 RepID=UPI003558F7A2
MAADAINPNAPDPIRAAEFAMSSELMLAGSVQMFQAALWGGNDHTIAHARANLEKAYSQHIDCIEARVIAARMSLRSGRK